MMLTRQLHDGLCSYRHVRFQLVCMVNQTSPSNATAANYDELLKSMITYCD